MLHHLLFFPPQSFRKCKNFLIEQDSSKRDARVSVVEDGEKSEPFHIASGNKKFGKESGSSFKD